MNGDPTSITLEPHWFIPTFIIAWFAITGLLALMSGWASLAKLFAAPGRNEGKRFRFSSGSMGRKYLPVSYRN